LALQTSGDRPILRVERGESMTVTTEIDAGHIVAVDYGSQAIGGSEGYASLYARAEEVNVCVVGYVDG
jgi:hypothetical protein